MHRGRARPENAKLELPPRPPSFPPTFLVAFDLTPARKLWHLPHKKKRAARMPGRRARLIAANARCRSGVFTMAGNGLGGARSDGSGFRRLCPDRRLPDRGFGWPRRLDRLALLATVRQWRLLRRARRHAR